MLIKKFFLILQIIALTFFSIWPIYAEEIVLEENEVLEEVAEEEFSVEAKQQEIQEVKEEKEEVNEESYNSNEMGIEITNDESKEELIKTPVVKKETKNNTKSTRDVKASTGYYEQVTDYSGKKVWEDDDDIEEIRPGSIEIVLLANGKETSYQPVWTKNGNEWTYTFKGLPIFDVTTGQVISYSVSEKNIPDGYELESKVTNTEYEIIESSLDGSALVKYPSCSTKTFNLSKTSADLYFFVVKKGNHFYIWTPRVITNAEEEAIFTEIDNSGLMNEIKESRTEFYAGFGRFDVPSGGYFEVTKDSESSATLAFDTSSTWSYWGEATLKTDEHIKYNVGTTELKNTHEVEYTEAIVVKEWDDDDNRDNLRTDSVTVKLSNGKTYVLSDANGWTITVKKLPTKVKGKEVTYSWEEINVPTGYTPKSKTEGTKTTITNFHEPYKTTVKVTKVWDDDDDAEGIRPDSVTIVLSNGDEAVLNEGNGWTYTFEKLFLNEDGSEIEYSITEKDVEGYEADITGDYREGFVVTNKIIPIGDEGEPEDSENPYTAGPINKYVNILLVSVFELLSTIYFFIKTN